MTKTLLQCACSKTARGLVPLGLLALAALPSTAQVKSGGTAGLTYLTAPQTANVREGFNQSDTNFFGFAEGQKVSVNNVATDAGTTTAAGSVTGVVNSYMLYTDKVGSSGALVKYDITVTFANTILGVVSSSSGLTATDSLLGLSGTKYPGFLTGGSTRGQEGGDYFTLLNAHTIVIHNETSDNVNELRVLTAVPELSTLLGFGSFLALGGLAASRQRRNMRKVA